MKPQKRGVRYILLKFGFTLSTLAKNAIRHRAGRARAGAEARLSPRQIKKIEIKKRKYIK
jgi:hypothetical protein